jgi:signal transduction histidine kinase
VIFQTLQSRDKYESTGIGLTIVKRIIAARGGKIRVESEMGNGTKFIVDWPK